MTRSTFLTLVAIIAAGVGGLALLAPETLLVEVKHAEAAPAALVMARTVGVVLIAFGGLSFSVRHHPMSPTLRAVLAANLALQVLLIPIDPIAFAQGTFRTLGSFVPNTILHFVLAAGFLYFLTRERREPEGRT